MSGAQGAPKPASHAAAEPLVEARRVIVEPFAGPGGAIPRRAVIAVLEKQDRLEVEPARLLQAHAGTLDGTAAGYAKVGEDLKLSAFVRGRTTKAERGYALTLTVVSATTGEVRGALTFTARRVVDLPATLQKELWVKLEPLLEPEPEPEPEPPPAEPVRAEPVAVPSPRKVRPRPRAERRGCSQLELTGHGGIVRRDYDYAREERGALRAYTLHRSPFVGLAATWFPAFEPGCPRLSRLGFAASYERMFGASSTLAGRTLATSAQAVTTDVLFRHALGPVSLTPRVGYRLRTFDVEDNVVPDVAYHGARAGVAVGTRLGPAEIELAGGLRWLVGFGEIGSPDWFPEVHGFAYDSEVRVGVAITQSVAVILQGAFEMTRLTFDVNPDSPSPNGVADGAYDRTLFAALGLRFALSTPPVRE